MKRYLIILAALLSVAGCAAGYTRAEYVYAEPEEHVYVVPVDRVVVVTRDVLVTRGWTVYRVQRSGRNRIIWARRGDDQIVRIFASPQGQRVVVRGLREERERERDERQSIAGARRAMAAVARVCGSAAAVGERARLTSA